MIRTFGRVPLKDERDNKYKLRTPRTSRIRRYWNDSRWFGDQGETPHCVGYAWAHWLLNSPMSQYLDPHGIYRYAQIEDEWPGEDYEGSSVRGGAKALKQLGFVTEYRWAWSLKPVVSAVLELGPVVVGTNWYTGMFEVDRYGFIHAEGETVGGHAYIINGVDTQKDRFRIKNSWGLDWGNHGRAWLSFNDAAKLIKEDGEVCLAVEQKPAA